MIITLIKTWFITFVIAEFWNFDGVNGDCPDVDQGYIQCGDFNLGALITVYENNRERECQHGVILNRRMQYVEAITYAVNAVNRNRNLLGNFTLGFAILNDCGGAGSATSTAIKLLPCDEDKTQQCCEGHIPNVVGTIGPLTSSQATVLSPILGYHGIVQISPMATSDVLSEKDKYPFFMRTIPPDKFKVKAIISILLHFGWTYISLLYENDKYGVANFIDFKSEIRNLDICIGFEEGVSQYWNNTYGDYLPIAHGLLRNSEAKVIVAFILPKSAQGILQSLKNLGSQVKFIWVGSETFDNRAVEGFEDMVLGSLHLSGQHRIRDSVFPDYFSHLNPENNSDNPWYEEFWEHSFNCEWESSSEMFSNNGSRQSCDLHTKVTDIPNFFHDTDWTYNFIDTVYIFAHAINRALGYCFDEKECHTCERQNVINCVRGKVLLEELKNTSYDGIVKHVEFDRYNDILRVNQIVQQLQKVGSDFEFQSVGYWNSKNGTVVIHNSPPLQWTRTTGKNDKNDDKNDWNEVSFNQSTFQAIPESVCSKLCGKGQETIVNDINPKCCWECIDCAVNEIVNNSRCTKCPTHMWPNYNRTDCQIILPYYIQLPDLPGYILLVLVIVAAVLLILATVTFIVFRDQKIIKASTPKLMLVTLSGLYLALMGCLMFLLEPTRISCTLLFVLFHIPFTMLYSPLLARTLRIYRVFSGSARLTTKIAFVRESCMFALVFTCVTLQVSLSKALTPNLI